MDIPKHRIIAYYPDLAREVGISAAIYYAQIVYWSSRGKRWDGYIYKSKPEFEQETALTLDQQDRARKLLVEKGWLLVKKTMANGHPTLHFKPLRAIESILDNPEHASPANSVVHDGVSRDSITETIRENSKDIFSSLSISKNTNKTETYLKNEAEIAARVASGKYKDPKYQCPENGPYDWRYVLNCRAALTPELLIIAMYWQVKDEYVAMKRSFSFEYTFETKDKANAVIKRDFGAARELAKTVEFNDILKLIDLAADASMNKDGGYWMEWKLGTLLNHVEKLADYPQS